MSASLVQNLKQQLEKHHFKIIDFILFQSAWMLCVIGQGRFVYIAIALVVLHFALSPSRLADAKLMVAVAIIGIALDYLLMIVGVFEFSQGVFPLWLIVLWLIFPLTLNHALSWLPQRSLPLQVVFGGFGGASSYVGGYFLGAVEFGYSFVACSLILLVVWALAFPIYCLIQKKCVSDA